MRERARAATEAYRLRLRELLNELITSRASPPPPPNLGRMGVAKRTGGRAAVEVRAGSFLVWSINGAH